MPDQESDHATSTESLSETVADPEEMLLLPVAWVGSVFLSILWELFTM